ncbi:MAG: hypothetical protein ABJA81_05120 [Nocardioidaceae bacterium]
MITGPGKQITWGELHAASRNVLDEVGFTGGHRASPHPGGS